MTVPMPCSDDDKEIETEMTVKPNGTEMIVQSMQLMNQLIDRNIKFREEQQAFDKKHGLGQYPKVSEE